MSPTDGAPAEHRTDHVTVRLAEPGELAAVAGLRWILEGDVR
ncbi:hypothetical protein ABT121_12220 [Streptomyces sp. NPDC001928]